MNLFTQPPTSWHKEHLNLCVTYYIYEFFEMLSFLMECVCILIKPRCWLYTMYPLSYETMNVCGSFGMIFFIFISYTFAILNSHESHNVLYIIWITRTCCIKLFNGVLNNTKFILYLNRQLHSFTTEQRGNVITQLYAYYMATKGHITMYTILFWA